MFDKNIAVNKCKCPFPFSLSRLTGEGRREGKEREREEGSGRKEGGQKRGRRIRERGEGRGEEVDFLSKSLPLPVFPSHEKLLCLDTPPPKLFHPPSLPSSLLPLLPPTYLPSDIHSSIFMNNLLRLRNKNRITIPT